MKHQSKLAVLSMLILIALISVNTIYAQPPLGSTQQGYPFESSPTNYTTDKSGTGPVTNPTAAYEGNLTAPPTCTISLNGIHQGGGFPPAPPDNDVRYIEFTAWTNNPDPLEFYYPPEWVAIKMRYDCPATTDDQYRIVYRVVPDLTWYVLQDWVSGSDAAITVGTTMGRDWPDIAEPNDESWSWADVGNLIVRIETQQVSTNDDRSISLYELWAQVYQAPKPPTASTAISVQPLVVLDILPGETFYVDVVVMGLTPPPGCQLYTINMEYDTNVLTATALYTYLPFDTPIFSAIDDSTGTLSVSHKVPVANTVGFLGNETSLARIYFVADAGGAAVLNITLGELKDVGAEFGYYPPTYDGWASGATVMSLITGSTTPLVYQLIDPITEPLTTWWHEICPDYCTIWHLTSWEDGQPEGEPGYGELSKCDQIDMVEETTGEKFWFHVVDVTVTVHWEFKDGAIDGPLIGEYGAAEPRYIGDPFYLDPWDPAGNPLYKGFHQLAPVFSREFGISAFVDTDGSGNLTVSDQIEILYVDVYPYEYAWAHVTGISTDIIISEKPPTPDIPEFPLGITLLMILAPIIPLAYLWRLRKKVTKQ